MSQSKEELAARCNTDVANFHMYVYKLAHCPQVCSLLIGLANACGPRLNSRWYSRPINAVMHAVQSNALERHCEKAAYGRAPGS